MGEPSTVHKHAHPPFEQFCAEDIGLFRRAHLLDERVRPRREEVRKIGRIGYAVDIDGFEPLFNASYDRFFRRPFQIAEGGEGL